jgi:hypothetical protein
MPRAIPFLALLAMLAACASKPVPQGESRTMAAYSLGSLAATLPERARVQGVTAAADATLRSRGYAVTATRSTADAGHVYAKSPVHPGPFAISAATYVDVSAHIVGSGTEVSIKVGDFGDEAESRAILDDILRRLDL